MNTIANNSIVEIAEMMNTVGLSLYIPRMSEKYTEDDIKKIFYTGGVGQVEYVDFVAVRDNTQSLAPVSEQKPKIVWYSAFIKLVCWGVNNHYLTTFVQNKSFKMYLSATEYWVVLPSKKELMRTRVNVHQLASYTEELFTKVAAYEEIIERQNKQIEVLERNSIRNDQLLEMLIKKHEKHNDIFELVLQNIESTSKQAL
jgi:hypothetical protein